MKPTSPSDLIRPFLDPRVPWLFLVGSLALAVLGNALSELLTNIFGATLPFLIGLIVSAIAIFLFVFTRFQRLVRAFNQPKRTAIPPEQQAPPHAGLILPIGLNSSGAEESIIRWHLQGLNLRHCWLLITPQVETHAKFGDLKQLLLEQNVRIHPILLRDAEQSNQIYDRVCAAIDEARTIGEAMPLIADITAGTKPMSAGTLLACQDEGIPIHYWSTPRDDRGNPRRTEDGQAMLIGIDLPTASTSAQQP